jgi:phosphoribosylformylglycinamidine cyclo-ligase
VGNLPRVLPERLGAVLERSSWVEPRIFSEIQALGPVDEGEMDRVFNRGIGMALVVAADRADDALAALAASDQPATVIGVVVDDGPAVRYR